MRWQPRALIVLGLALAGCGGDDRTKVPDVTGLRALDAQRVIANAGLSATLDPKSPSPTKCEVTDQSAQGKVPRGTEIVLKVSCPYQRGED